MAKAIVMVDELFHLREEFLQRFLAEHEVKVISDPEYDFARCECCQVARTLAISPSVFGWSFDSTFFDKFPLLKAICLSGGWHDHVDKDYCRKRNVVLTNVPEFSSRSSAEWCIAVALTLLRNMKVLCRERTPVNRLFPGGELHGKVVGIIGMGGIGNALLRMLSGFGVRCLYWSRRSRAAGARYTSLQEVVAEADVLFLTFYECSDTKGLINASVLGGMKPESILVSGLGSQPGLVSECVDWPTALRMVRSGRLAGLAVECGEGELLDPDHDRIITSQGHSGWCTWEALKRGTEIWIENILGVEAGTAPNVVLEETMEGH